MPGSFPPQDYNAIGGSVQNNQFSQRAPDDKNAFEKQPSATNDQGVVREDQENDLEQVDVKSSSPQKAAAADNGVIFNSHNSVNESPSKNEDADHISSK